MDTHGLEILEFARALAAIQACALTPRGRHWLAALHPQTQTAAIRRRHSLYAELAGLERTGEPLPQVEFPDLTEVLARVAAFVQAAGQNWPSI